MDNELNYIDIEIDKLTKSIENVITHEVFDTELIKISYTNTYVVNPNDWIFDWKSQIAKTEREVYKLVIKENHEQIQGLISLTDRLDHIYINLLERSNLNKGKNKIYYGVPGNLVSYACKVSFDKGYEGFVAFDAKTKLIQHYQETLFASHFKGTRMFIDTIAATKLVNQYFNR